MNWVSSRTQHHAVEAAHADVEEDRVDRPAVRDGAVEQPERGGPVAGGEHVTDAGVGAQQVGDVLQRGLLVVHRQNPQTAHDHPFHRPIP